MKAGILIMSVSLTTKTSAKHRGGPWKIIFNDFIFFSFLQTPNYKKESTSEILPCVFLTYMTTVTQCRQSVNNQAHNIWSGAMGNEINWSRMKWFPQGLTCTVLFSASVVLLQLLLPSEIPTSLSKCYPLPRFHSGCFSWIILTLRAHSDSTLF